VKVFWFGLLLACCAAPATAGVDASQYDAFWLWSGVQPQPVLARAKSLYILQGQIERAPRTQGGAVRFLAQGMSVPRLADHPGEIWLAYRAQTLAWPPEAYAVLLSQLRRWELAGNAVVGIQIDFDARTRELHNYVKFLRDLRERLPQNYRLSITGLLDWAPNADPAVLNQLAGVVDEIVIQTYQGRHSIANYSAYLPPTRHLQLPFKIGLVQYGDWQAPDYLEGLPLFRGYVVFLLNAPASPH
jgi:hypothetical protein